MPRISHLNISSATCLKNSVLVFWRFLNAFVLLGTTDPKFGTDMKASLLIPYRFQCQGLPYHGSLDALTTSNDSGSV